MKRLRVEVTTTATITVDVEEDGIADQLLAAAPCDVDDLPGGEGENVRSVIMDQDMEFTWEVTKVSLGEQPKSPPKPKRS